MTKLTIIIPTFNAEATIEKTLFSILNQTITDYKLIIIDGNSTDDTLKIVKRYSHVIDLLVSEPDKGIYDAMNKGVANTNTEFILFLGADDTFYNSTVLEMTLPLLKGNTVYYGQSWFLKKQKLYDGKFSYFKFALRNICHQASFYPTRLLKNMPFDLRYPLLADYHLNLCLLKSNVDFVYIPYIISNFNDSASSATLKDLFFEKNKLRLVKESLGTLPYLYAVLRRTVKRILK